LTSSINLLKPFYPNR